METVLLFDIDGTLLTSSPRRGYRREVERAVASVFGTCGRLAEISFDGKTDLAILREALECEGISPATIRERLGDWETVFLQLTARFDHEAPLFVPCPGVGDLLATLERDGRFLLSLLTGNIEAMAHAKLAAIGLAHHFRVRGAYGNDHENRNELPAIAARRIHEQTGRAYRPEQFVIIGDTPRDIEAARHFRMRSIAVATGNFGLDELAAHGPDALLSDLRDVDAVLASIGNIG